jgi:signal transduction histidine kinase
MRFTLAGMQIRTAPNMFRYWVRSLSARLWLTSVTALVICLGVIAAITMYTFSHSPPRMLQRHADIRAAQRIVDGLRFDSHGQPVAVALDEQSAWLFNVATNDLMYRVLDDRGHLLLASGKAAGGEQWEKGNPAEESREDREVSINGRPFDLVTRETQRGNARFVVQVATSVAFNKAVLSMKVKPIPGIVGWTIALATIIFGLTLTFTVHRLLRPLRAASRAAASITPSSLTMRLSDKGMPSEIKPLITAFNDALSRLENGFIVQQAFLASAAHELQTPLTLIRGQIELQPGIEKKELIYREIDLMARQVRQLLHLAEVSESQNFVFSDVNWADVAADVAGYFALKASTENVSLELDSPVIASVIKADRSALFILLKNLVENAINVTPAGGRVTVSVDGSSIRVSDEGHGIDPEHLPFLFQRFWRAPDVQHDGAGLGLAICKEIAGAHGWQINVRRLQVGTAFSVVFNA